MDVEDLSLVGRRRNDWLGGWFCSRGGLKIQKAVFFRRFWRFAAAGLPANTPAVPSAPSQRVVPNLGTVGAMMPLNLIWLVHGGFWVKKWCPKTLHFFVFGENQREFFSGKISAPAYLYLT